MTTGLKTPSSYYIQLITTFPPRPITNDTELIATQSRISSILDSKTITQDDRDYINVLGTLIYEYEENEAIPILKGIKLLKALIVEYNIKEEDLASIFQDESSVTNVLTAIFR